MAVWRNGRQAVRGAELEFLVGLSQQAAIALHNARLFDETKEALDRQTATAEVLQVISGSVEDTQPVFEKILDSCERIFGTGHLGLVVVGDDGLVHPAAMRGDVVRKMTRTLPLPVDREHDGPRHPRATHRPDRRRGRARRVERVGARARWPRWATSRRRGCR